MSSNNDAETKTHYNFNRDYDPETGRYVQSDPIGLDGGMNGYIYSNQNSITRFDIGGKKTVVVISYGSYYGITLGDHAGLYLSRGDSGNEVIYDPSGSYRAYVDGGYSKERPNSGYFFRPNWDISLQDYRSYQVSSGSDFTKVIEFNTTQNEESRIASKAIEVGDPRGLNCANYVGYVLKESGINIFSKLASNYTLPGSLYDDLYDIKNPKTGWLWW